MSVAELYKQMNIKGIDPNTFQLLLEISACDLEKPLSKLDVDWRRLLHAIESQGISGLAYYYFYHNKDLDYIPQEFKDKLWEYHHFIALHMAEKYQTIKSVIGLLNERGISFLVIKGPTVAKTIYPDTSLRFFADLDILAHPGDRKDIHDILCTLGYQLEAGYLEPLPKLIPNVVNDHHTRYENLNSKLPIEVHWEDILIDDLVPRDLPAMWRRAVPITIEGVAVKTLCLEDHLLHLCAHAHHHRFEYLYRISDLLFILRDHFDEIDWDLFLETVRIEEAQVPVYFSFRLVSQLYGLALPEELMDQLKPDSLRRWLHEHFFKPTFLVVEDQEDEIPFSFKSTPWIKSTLLNLLLMSRRIEKIQYLVRLIFPSNEWIRQRYQVSYDKSLIPYYVLRYFLPTDLMDNMMSK